MANSRTGVPQMTSDGKRMRIVWKPGDGDGDSSTYLVERSLNILRGHPTWKVFMGDVNLLIERGSKDEPPYYVYLDDRACYFIYKSKAYRKDELNIFWPFDFNNHGHIKQGRKNRGRVAYLDDSRTVIAKEPLRGKGKWFEFSGDPEVVAYYAVRPRTGHMERQVAEELAKNSAGKLDTKDVSQGFADNNYKTSQASLAAATLTTNSSEDPTPNINTARPSRRASRPPRPPPKRVLLEDAEELHPKEFTPQNSTVSVNNSKNTYALMPNARSRRSPASSANTHYAPMHTPSTSVIAPLQIERAFLSSPFRSDTLFRYGQKMTPKPVAIPPRVIHSSPYGAINPVSNFRSTPHAVPGDLANTLGRSLPLPLLERPGIKRNWFERKAVMNETPENVLEETIEPVADEVPTPVTKEKTRRATTPSTKRNFIMPFDTSSSDTDSSPATPPAKRVQVASSSASDA